MAFIYMNGQMTPLGTLGGDSAATQINNSNVIVGMSQTSPGGPQHAFRMLVGGSMQDLGTGPWAQTRAEASPETFRSYKAFGDDSTETPYIETIPRRGYRFAA